MVDLTGTGRYAETPRKDFWQHDSRLKMIDFEGCELSSLHFIQQDYNVPFNLALQQCVFIQHCL